MASYHQSRKHDAPSGSDRLTRSMGNLFFTDIDTSVLALEFPPFRKLSTAAGLEAVRRDSRNRGTGGERA